MRLFLDTNVFIEYLCGRSKATIVRDLLDVIEDKEHQAFFSTSSLCTIAYYVDITLSHRGIHKPEKTDKIREILNLILGIATIADINHSHSISATNDQAFSDIEDSVQYQCALSSQCEVLITFNVRDFKNVTDMKVMTPEEFLLSINKR